MVHIGHAQGGQPDLNDVLKARSTLFFQRGGIAFPLIWTAVIQDGLKTGDSAVLLSSRFVSLFPIFALRASRCLCNNPCGGSRSKLTLQEISLSLDRRTLWPASLSLFNAKWLVTSPVRHGVHVQVGIRRQAPDRELK